MIIDYTEIKLPFGWWDSIKWVQICSNLFLLQFPGLLPWYVTRGKYNFNRPNCKTTQVFVETKKQRSIATLHTLFSFFSHQQCFTAPPHSSSLFLHSSPIQNVNSVQPLFSVSTVLRRPASDTDSKSYHCFSPFQRFENKFYRKILKKYINKAQNKNKIYKQSTKSKQWWRITAKWLAFTAAPKSCEGDRKCEREKKKKGYDWEEGEQWKVKFSFLKSQPLIICMSLVTHLSKGLGNWKNLVLEQIWTPVKLKDQRWKRIRYQKHVCIDKLSLCFGYSCFKTHNLSCLNSIKLCSNLKCQYTQIIHVLKLCCALKHETSTYYACYYRDGNGYLMGRVLQCPSPYPHL